MTNYCTYCGKPLQEGSVCMCRTAQTPPPVQPQMNAGETGAHFRAEYKPKLDSLTKCAVTYLKKVFAQFKANIKAPATGLHGSLESADFPLAIGFLVIQAFLSALFSAVIFQKAGTFLYQTFGSVTGIFTHILFLLKVSVLTLLLSLLLSAALAGILFLVAKLAKSQATYQRMTCLIAAKCMITAPLMLASILLLFVNLSIGIGFYFLASFLGMLYIAMYFNHAALIDANLVIWIISAAMFLYMVVSFAIVKNTAWLYLPMGYMDYFGGALNVVDYLNLASEMI